MWTSCFSSVSDVDRAGWGRAQDVWARFNLQVVYGSSGGKSGGHRGLSWPAVCASLSKPEV